ncbi:MAG: GGDEF domain-containing protein [Pseudomonadota bacterium]
MPCLFAASGVVGIVPIIFVRAYSGEYVIAIIDTVIAASFAVITWVIYRYDKVRPASVFLALVCTFAVVTVIHVKGSEMLFWAYPTIVGMFFLLRPKESVVLTIVAVLAVLPVLIAEQQSILTSVVLMSMLITLINAAGFAALTMAQRKRLKEITLLDPLTGADNRRAMDEAVPEIIGEARESELPVSLIMLDIDYFKRINDDYGHAAGDQVLIEVAQTIFDNTRPTDRLFRVGGEEFVVVAAGAGIELGRRLGEKLREAVAALRIPPRDGSNKTLEVTISLGVAELLPRESPDNWHKRADNALYEAKRSGRNRTHLADKTVSLSGSNAYAV